MVKSVGAGNAFMQWAVAGMHAGDQAAAEHRQDAGRGRCGAAGTEGGSGAVPDGPPQVLAPLQWGLAASPHPCHHQVSHRSCVMSHLCLSVCACKSILKHVLALEQAGMHEPSKQQAGKVCFGQVVHFTCLRSLQRVEPYVI